MAPGQAGYDDASLAWNLAVAQRPAAVVTAETIEDVQHAVALARERGLRIAPQGTGHGAAALGSLQDAILLRTDRMRELAVDPETGIVRIGAGIRWQEAVEAAARHGLALLAGSSPDAGVVGYTLGGGLSFLGRRHGLACNRVEAIELVTADGRALRADHDHAPDLFWALRGGGGNFGVVTAIELRALPLTDVYAGILWWPIERDEEVLQGWRAVVEAGLPEELATLGRYLRLPDLPAIPEPVRGRSFVVVEAVHSGDPSVAHALLAPLRALRPEIDTLATMPVQALGHLHMDPEQPVPACGDGMLLDDLPSAAIDALTAAAGASVSSPLLSVEIRQLGGALARDRPDHGALSSIGAAHLLYAVGMVPGAEAAAAVERGLDELRAAMAPWASPVGSPNFAETRRDPASLWGEHALARLRHVKRRHDPDDLFRANHPIWPG